MAALTRLPPVYATVTNVLLALSPLQMDALNDYCIGKTGISLADKIDRWNLGFYS